MHVVWGESLLFCLFVHLIHLSLNVFSLVFFSQSDVLMSNSSFPAHLYKSSVFPLHVLITLTHSFWLPLVFLANFSWLTVPLRLPPFLHSQDRNFNLRSLHRPSWSFFGQFLLFSSYCFRGIMISCSSITILFRIRQLLSPLGSFNTTFHGYWSLEAWFCYIKALYITLTA